MTNSSEINLPNGPAKGEVLLAAGVFALLGLLEFAVTGGFAMLGRHLWLDEVYTFLLCTDPSITHSMKALKHGADAQGPGFYLICRGLGFVFGGISIVQLRWVGCLGAWAAVVGVYAILRRSVNRLAAVAGALIVWGHPVVVWEMFNARAYTPMLAAAVWLCWGLGTPKRSRLARVVLAICSILLCTLHYFGAVALILAVAGYWIAYRKNLRLRGMDWCALAAGPLALAGCMPFLMGRYGTLGNTTWVPNPSLANLRSFVMHLVPVGSVIVPPMVFLITVILRKLKGRSSSIKELSALAALGGMPVMILAFSIMIQPALIPRYAIAGAAALAVPTAILINRVPRGWAVCACLALAAVGMAQMKWSFSSWILSSNYEDRSIEDVRRLTSGATVVFDSPHELLPMIQAAPDLRQRCALWGVGEDKSDPKNEMWLFETKMANVLRGYYGYPEVVDQNQMEAMDHYYIVFLWVTPEEAAARLPGFDLVRVAGTGDNLKLYRAQKSAVKMASLAMKPNQAMTAQ